MAQKKLAHRPSSAGAIQTRRATTRRIGLRGLALLLATGTSGHALAQSTQVPVPKPRSVVDANGVNLANGQLELDSNDLSIGDASNGLAFVRHYIFSGWRHDYVAAITVDGPITLVSIGDDTTTFSQANGAFSDREGTGATLSLAGGVYTYTARDGTVALFDLKVSVNNRIYYGNIVGVATQITRPNGEVLTLTNLDSFYTYQNSNTGNGEPFEVEVHAIRLQSVKNSYGFQLKLAYANNVLEALTISDWVRIAKVTAINNAVEYCDPAADECVLAQPWQSVSYAVTPSGANRVETVTQPMTDGPARVTTYTSGANGLMAAIVRPRQSYTTTFNYTDNRVQSVSNGVGTWTYAWSLTAPDMTTTITDPLNHQNVIVTDVDLGVVKSQTDGASRTDAFQYDSSGRLTVAYPKGGGAIGYDYDSRGNVRQMTHFAAPSGQTAIAVTASYPPTCVNRRHCNKPDTTTDALGNVTEYSYDEVHGGVTSIKSPAPVAGADRPETRYSYEPVTAYYKDHYKDKSGSIVAGPGPIYKLTATSACATGASCTGAANEVRATIGYGTAGVANNLYATEVSTGAGSGSPVATAVRTHDRYGNVDSVDGPLPGADDTTRLRYNAVREVVQVTGPDPDGAGALLPRSTVLARNGDGLVELTRTGTANADGSNFAELVRQTRTYDGLDRVASERLAMGGVSYATSQYGYYPNNLPRCSAQRMDRTSLDDLSVDACTQDPTPGADGPDRITLQSYDAADQPTVTTSGLATSLQRATQSIAYGANGLPASVADANGNTTGYGYDGYQRRYQTRYPDASTGQPNPNDYEELTLDARSQVTALRTRSGSTIDYSYDALGRLTFKGRPGSEPDVGYHYDNLGRLIGAADNQGHVVTRSYDGLGQLRGETSAGLTLNYDYDLAGRRTALQWGDSGRYFQYTYLVTGETQQVRENGAAGGVGLLGSYYYDDLGRPVALARGNGTQTSWAYAGTPWLASLTHDLSGAASDVTRSFTRDASGAIRSATLSNEAYAFVHPANVGTGHTIDRLNRYTARTGTGAGPIVYDPRGNVGSQPGRNYIYTADNLLAFTSGGNFGYDPLDRLETADQGATRFRYGGEAQPVAEYAPNGVLTHRYVPGIEDGAPVAGYEGDGYDRRWYYTDERGSVMAVANAAGNVTTKLSYDQDGNPGAGNTGRFQYTGQMWLPEIGAYHYRTRAYDPKLGRFLQTDPIGYAGGMNLYAYVGAIRSTSWIRGGWRRKRLAGRETDYMRQERRRPAATRARAGRYPGDREVPVPRVLRRPRGVRQQRRLVPELLDRGCVRWRVRKRRSGWRWSAAKGGAAQEIDMR